MTTTEPTPDVQRQPIYWFVILEEAVKSGDHVAAAEAQRALARLGVMIRYGRSAAEAVEASHE